MEHAFIITDRSDLIGSLKRFFRFSRGMDAQAHAHLKPASRDPQWVQQTFKRIAGWMEGAAARSGGACSLRNSVAIVELYDAELDSLVNLNPIAAGSAPWASVVAMLIMAFPDVHWVFISPHEPLDSSFYAESHLLRAGNGLAGILALNDSGLVPLFDPSGLRSAIHARLRTCAVEAEAAPYIAVRERVAAAIDEEEAYASFNAYTAFRFGFRSHVVTSWAMMRRLFRPELTLPALADRYKPELVFEDIYLKFPDKDYELSLSDLNKRDEEFPPLTKVKYRIFVTVGHRRGAYTQRWHQGQSHLEDLKAVMWLKVLYKPFSGMFDLWQRSGLGSKLRMEGFVWGADKSDPATAAGGHSAPGRLLLIAERLINRSTSILRSADSVSDAVHGAALALNAQELLGGRTPTTMLEALALKHQLEVLAECMFYGVEYNMNVKSRFDEIERDVMSAQRWFHPKKRRLSALNAQIRIINELSLKFREHNQFDEEQQCLAKLRELHRHLWFRKHAWWTWLVYPARWYIDFLLSSVLRFALAISFWIMLFGLLFAYVPHTGWPAGLSPALHGLTDSVTAFFGLQLSHDTSALQTHALIIINLFVILSGFLHLGILVSHLYSIAVRR